MKNIKIFLNQKLFGRNQEIENEPVMTFKIEKGEETNIEIYNSTDRHRESLKISPIDIVIAKSIKEISFEKRNNDHFSSYKDCKVCSKDKYTKR